MMSDAIRDFATQFAFRPVIENKKNFRAKKRFLVCGMGGSHLGADLLPIFDPGLDVVVWKNYGLPRLNDLKERLVVFCSYSGNTEEIINGFTTAHRLGLDTAVVTTGGALLWLAEKYKVPFVRIPNTGLQPRSATGYMFMGFLKLLGEEKLLRDAAKLQTRLRPADYEKQARDLAKKLQRKVPVVYACLPDSAVAQIWKIKLNETAKIPAFWNTLPEMNHNEMTSFDVIPSTKSLAKNFHFILLKDEAYHAGNLKRMEILKHLLRRRGLHVTDVPLSGQDVLLKIFSSVVLADWTAYYLSQYYGTEAEQVPMVEEFKKLIKK